MTKAKYDLYLNLPTTGVVQAAEVIIFESPRKGTLVGFRYVPDYLNNPYAISLDPVQLPLEPSPFEMQCAFGVVPAFLDDYLPDAWGKKVLTALALHKHQQKLNANSAIDMLTLMGGRHIGALQLVPAGGVVNYASGHGLSHLLAAEQAAQMLDAPYGDIDFNKMNLLYLASSGSGVGGARPKALISENDRHYLAKFNRLDTDKYNNATVELACLTMAKAAGLQVGGGRVERSVNQRDVLLLERFDIDPAGYRHHLISLNGLLKEPASQLDTGATFRYNDIHQVLRRYSTQIETDLEQLLLLMLFNRAINNTDDHERNFSLINAGDGYRLAPAYDMVPDLAVGQYHAAGYNYQLAPPTPSEAKKEGKIFGLSKVKVGQLADAVICALDDWSDHAEQAGVSEEDASNIAARLKR